MPVRNPSQPQVKTGFEHVQRFYDTAHDCWAAQLLPGEFYVSAHGEMITTILGSCISVCIRDVVRGIGGMNHFMLPVQPKHDDKSWDKHEHTRLTCYGYFAMEHLLNSLYLMGARKKHLEIKVYGGAQVLAKRSNIGLKNILFIYDYLSRKDLPIKAVDLGNHYIRRIFYSSRTGDVFMKRDIAKCRSPSNGF